MTTQIKVRSGPLPQSWIHSHVALRRFLVLLLLTIHGMLVAWPAWCWSPTVDEVAHLPSGISHWKSGRFDLYRVNPPLIRMIAAIPILRTSAKVDWSSFSEHPYARSEFSICHPFVRSNGPEILKYFTWARWACIPVTILGAWVCYRWGRECYGPCSGLIALILYVFCPNVIGNAALITPDAGAAAIGALAGYTFWRWIRQPTLLNMAIAGGSLGMAELTKSTWIILFVMWPSLTFIWWATSRFVLKGHRETATDTTAQTAACYVARPIQLFGLIGLGIYILNLGYGFEKSFQRLDQFHFISHALGGKDAHDSPGNRFSGTMFGYLPVPLPANYVLGIDVQRHDLEKEKWSYLRGEQKMGGWWYYYLYALWVKVPLGTIAAAALALITTVIRCRRNGWDVIRNDIVILLPGLTILALVSSQTGFNRHLRYALPMLPFVYVWISQIGYWYDSGHEVGTIHLFWRRFVGCFCGAMLLLSIGSSMWVWPHSLSYFNEWAGGPQGGPHHLLDTNIDWGQDLIYFKNWVAAHPDAKPLYLTYFGFFDPKTIGLECLPVPGEPISDQTGTMTRGPTEALTPGWFAISVNKLYGYKHTGGELDQFSYLRSLRPVDHCGHSILIFRLTPNDVDRIRTDWEHSFSK